MKQNSMTKKLSLAGILVAIAVVGSLISVPIAGSRCAPVQHMVNVMAAVLLGPWWGVVIAFCASLIRNMTALGSLMAFPGSMVGALCCGLAYHICRNIGVTCLAETVGTGFLGGLAAYPIARLVMGLQPAGYFVYVIPFLISTVAGSILAYILVKILGKNKILGQIQDTF